MTLLPTPMSILMTTRTISIPTRASLSPRRALSTATSIPMTEWHIHTRMTTRSTINTITTERTCLQPRMRLWVGWA